MERTFTLRQIKNDPCIQRFLKMKSGRRESTIDGYLYSIRDFCNFTGKSPSEIHDIQKSDLRERKPEFDQWLNEALDDYIAHNIEEGYRKGGISYKIAKLKAFFNAFKLQPPSTNIPIRHVREDAKYSLKVEDIRKAVKNSPPTYQALFITQAQTGLSLSDALLLDVKDFILAVSKPNEELSVKEAIYRVKTEDNIIGCFDLRRKKTSQEFYTFVGPEALRNIASLLESRDEHYLQMDSPIFTKDISRISIFREEARNDIRLNASSVKKFIGRLHGQKGIFPRIEVDGKDRNYFRSHKLRKWFSNQLKFKAGFPSDDVKYLMGQKTGDVLEQYIDVNNYKALKGNYRKALPHLAINDEIILEENQEAIEKLESENTALRNELADIKSKLPDLKELKDLLSDPEIKQFIEQRVSKISSTYDMVNDPFNKE